MSKIVFFELNLFTIFFSLILKLLNFNIFFFFISPSLRKKLVIKSLKKIGILHLNFNDKKTSLGNNYLLLKKNCFNKAKRLSLINSNKIWSNDFKEIFSKKTYLKIYLINYFSNKLLKILILFELMKNKQNKNEFIFFWLNNDILSRETIKEYKNFIIIKPKFLNFISNFTYLISLLLKKIKPIFNFRKKLSIFTSYNIHKLKFFNTIFFVKGGIISAYSNYLDKKNFFFSEKVKDKIYKKNILISEVDKNLDRKSLSFYKKYNLKFFYWFKKKKNLNNIELSKLILSMFKSIFKLDIATNLQIFIASKDIQENFKTLEDFPNLTSVIIDSEFQFPTTLAIALKKRDIRINCLQKRIKIPAQKYQFIVDNYFAFGKKTQSDLKYQLYKNVQPYLVGGKETVPETSSRPYFLKFKKRYKLICLVVDFHSSKDWYSSSINPNGNWKNNLEYYKTVLKISKLHPDILFILKGKNYFWTEISYFNSIHKEIKKQKNIIIFKKTVKMTNYQIIKNVDFTIAKYSSIVDDFLMNNKPVIIYEKSYKISHIIDYDKMILAEDSEKLNTLIISIKKKYFLFNFKLNKLRKKFYTKFSLKRYQDLLRKNL